MAQVSLVRVISWSSHDERISSTSSSPLPSASSSSHSSSISCTSSYTSSTTLRAVVTLRTSPEKRWTPLTTPTSSQKKERATMHIPLDIPAADKHNCCCTNASQMTRDTERYVPLCTQTREGSHSWFVVVLTCLPTSTGYEPKAPQQWLNKMVRSGLPGEPRPGISSKVGRLHHRRGILPQR